MSTEAEPTVSRAPSTSLDEQAWPYFVPLVGFIVLTALEGRLPTTPAGDPVPGWFVGAYALKMVVVSVLLWVCRTTWKDLKTLPSAGGLALAVGLGVAVIVAWVGLDPFYPKFEALMGKRTAFDPHSLPTGLRVPFLALRFFGLVVLVPIIEELFYRSFLIRWIIDPDFAKIPIGKVTTAGLAVTAAMFGASHPEWLPAILTALAWGWLLAQTKSVSACVISHATANLVLGVYVLATGDWKYW
ncbi:MAG: CAAX prenyl protease-related protein [Isosphaeraceae bacterium]